MSTAARSTMADRARGEPMKTYSVVMATRGPKEYAVRARPEARDRFLEYLRKRDALIHQEIVDGPLQSLNTHSPGTRDLKIRRARVRQEIVDRDIKAPNQCGSALRRQMRREKIRRDRYRRYFAKENLNSSNLDLKIRRAHARQKLVDIDLRCDGRLGSGR